MGKIPIQELARMMGVANQDLVFKLKSIGVRIEGEDALIDSDAIQAILQGKKLPQPREVILRDEAATPEAPRRTTTASDPRRPAGNPLRPGRPRSVIQKVEPPIRTLPTSERALIQDIQAASEAVTEEAPSRSTEPGAEPSLPGEFAPGGAETAPGSASPVVGSPPAGAPAATPPPAVPRRGGATIISRPAPGSPPQTYPGSRRPSAFSSSAPGASRGPGGPRPGPGGPSRGGPGMGRPMGPGGAGGYSRPGGPPGARPSGPGARPGGPSAPGASRPGSPASRPGLGLPPRPGAAPPRPGSDRERAEQDRDKKAKKTSKKLVPSAAEGEDLRNYMGSVHDIEAAQNELIDDGSASARRRRRVERKESEDAGKVLTFHRPAPSGPVMISEGMTVREFSEKLGVKTRDLIKLLFDRGIVSNINHVIDTDLAEKLASEMGIETMIVTFEEEVQLQGEQDPKRSVEGLAPRGPVVTIMGHVDHGKTSLLDAIRSSNVTAGESGGITQHIGAYHVDVGDRKIVFLDTPGHEAFTMMRARGARVTDLVVLVVAADDGVMPQTIEAIDHARAAKVPIVVAINKIDKPNANPDRVKKELADRGLMVEEWGGQTVAVPVSALKRQGIKELLEMILLTADLLNLRANPDSPAQGTVLEARKEVGRGVVGTVLVQNGSLRVGDIFVAGATWGRVRAMADENGQRPEAVGPATPVEVTGFSEVPAAGDVFQVVEEESKARTIVEFRRQEQRKREMAPTQGSLTLEQLFTQIERGDVKELPVVLKADVHGSVEVLRDTMTKLSTDKVRVNVIHTAVGAISTNDVLLAAASKAVIVGFSVRPEKNAAELAEKEGVDIRLHTVIYEVADELRKAMTGLLEPVFKEVLRGRAEVREIFKVPKIGVIAGSHVLDGVVPRSANIRLVRDGRVVYEGKISSLRRFKDDASEVRAGFDCGIGLDRFQDMKPGDVVEAFVREEVAPTL